jgi:methionine synthase / methylenetetrahydrofolate reductase(NADPH)
MINPFLSRLKRGVVICDGAMGTYLNQKGVSYERSFDELNLSKPDLISQIHREYIDAGAEIIETNTFGANLSRLSSHGLEDKVREINMKAVKNAREARDVSGKDVLIAGSIGPLGKQLEPYGKIRKNIAADIFREQVESLLEGGIDLFMIETIANLEEMELAVGVIKKITDLPIVAQMTFTAEGMTLLGNTPEDVAAHLVPLGVDVIGANCSVGPQKMLDVIQILSEFGATYVSAQPNAGLPRLYNGRFVYFSSPDYLAEYALKFVESGATIVGGCCGTTPEHIAAIATALRDIHPATGKLTTGHADRGQVEIKSAFQKKSEKTISPFLEKLSRELVISVELDPPKGSNPEKLIKVAAELKQIGADAVNIADSPLARVKMSCLALAYLIRQSVDIDIILHFTTRDRNLMGLQADLLGAHAIGIKDILALTGDPPSLGDYPQATAVYDVDSIGLVSVIQKLNSGFDFFGNSIGKPTNFSIGVAFNPTAPDYNLELSRLQQKIEAGGQYVFTQPMFDIDLIKRSVDDIAKYNLPIMLGILPLVSYKHAEFLHNEVPGITIPKNLRDKMNQAGEKSSAAGQDIAIELIEQSRGYIGGLYLMPSFGKFEVSMNIIKQISR